MASALPSGYVSVPSEQSVGWSAAGRVRVRKLTGVSATWNGWTLVGKSFSGGFYSADIIDPDGVTHNVEPLEHISGSFPWSAWYDFAEIGAAFRKGRKLELVDSPGTPRFGQRDWVCHESWFTDASSTISQTFGAFTHTQTYSDPPALFGPVIGTQEWHSISTIPQLAGAYPLVQWDSWSLTDWDAGTLTSLDDGTVRGTGSGAAEMYHGFGNDAKFMAPAYVFTYDVTIDKFGTAAPDWARVIDRWYCQGASPAAYVTFPDKNGSVTAQNVSWALPSHQGFGTFTPASLGTGAYLQFLLQDAWLASLDPPLEAGDHFVGIRGPCGLDAPSSPTTYQPVGIKVLASVDVHRPDGNKPSSWVFLSGSGSVADGATNVVFTVVAGGDAFRRTLDTNWRALADYRNTRHASPHDV